MILTPAVFAATALILAKFAASAWLDSLNAANVRANSRAVPPAFSGIVEEADYFKSVRYTLDKIRFGLFEGGYSSAVLVLFLVFGAYPALFCSISQALGGGIWAQAAALCLASAVAGLPELPAEWYSQFVLEQRYGFNKSTLALWISDKLKELALSLALGIPLLSLILWLFGVFENTWWIWGFCAVAVFQIAMLIVYPRLIMPLFNKVSPLEAGELRDRLLSMADRAGFRADSIFVMDGSRRSSHSNAFFTGFGKFRRIVLFDTLLTQLSPLEIEAVLAHEIGHYKRGHVPKMIASAFAMLFAGFAAVAWLAKSPRFYEGFGFEISDGMAPALLLFTVLAPLVTFWLTPVSNMLSRRYEYQADAFAKKVCGGEGALVSALRKLHTKNLGNLTPHRIYSAFHYSHPTLLEREAALSAK